MVSFGAWCSFLWAWGRSPMLDKTKYFAFITLLLSQCGLTSLALADSVEALSEDLIATSQDRLVDYCLGKAPSLRERPAGMGKAMERSSAMRALLWQSGAVAAFCESLKAGDLDRLSPTEEAHLSAASTLATVPKPVTATVFERLSENLEKGMFQRIELPTGLTAAKKPVIVDTENLRRAADSYSSGRMPSNEALSQWKKWNIEPVNHLEASILFGPSVGLASGSIMDGMHVASMWRNSLRQSAKTSLLLASYGSCLSAKRSYALREGQYDDPTGMGDIYEQMPPWRASYEGGAKRWRDVAIRYRNFLFDLSRTVASNQAEAESFRKIIDSVAKSQTVAMVVPVGPNKAKDSQAENSEFHQSGSCAVDQDLEHWTAGFRPDERLAKLSPYQLSRFVRTCDLSFLSAGASILSPKSFAEAAEGLGRINESADPGDMGGLDPLEMAAGNGAVAALMARNAAQTDAKGAGDSESAQPGATNTTNAGAVRDAAGVWSIESRFQNWIAGRYGNKGPAGASQVDGFLTLSPDGARLFANDWRLPDFPCRDLGGLASDRCQDGTDLSDAERSNSARVLPGDVVATAFQRLRLAVETMLLYQQVVGVEEVATGAYRSRLDVARSCMVFLKDASPALLRDRRAGIVTASDEQMVDLAVKFEDLFEEFHQQNTFIHLKQQEMLFGYAKKMRDATANQDTFRQQLKIRRRENVGR